MTRTSPQNEERGSVVLVALCFVTILGIALASYLAVSNQAMKLSNRSYLNGVSEQLAEAGLERALWSINRNNWSDWDIATIPGSATRTITYPASKFGNGVIGSINLRIDHHNATVWNNKTAYTVAAHDIVWFQGVWYQCKLDDSSHAKPTDTAPTNWVGAPAAWNASANYLAYNIVLHNGSVYRATASNHNQSPTDPLTPSGLWTLRPAATRWNSSASYAVDDIVLYGGVPYRCWQVGSGQPPTNPAYWASAPVVYAQGVAAPPDPTSAPIKIQLLSFIAPASLFPNAIAATATLNLNSPSAAGLVDSYNAPLGAYNTVASSTNAQLGFSAVLAGENTGGPAVKMTGGTLQGYIAAPPINVAPFSPNVSLAGVVKATPSGTGLDLGQVSRSPSIPQLDFARWDSAKVYRVNDVVQFGSGVPDLYLCIIAPPSFEDPSNTAYWSKNVALNLSPGADTPIGTPGALVPSLYYIDNASTGTVDLNGATTTLTINGPVVLNVPADLRIRNGGNLIVENTGSAAIVVGGRLRIGGTGGIENKTFDPKKLILIGTAIATPFGHTFSAVIPFYGTIYLPNATSALTFSNTSGSDPVIYGAISGKYINFNSVATVHYDTSLRSATFAGVDSPFIFSEWRELTDQADRVTLP